jgi:hypothetical protein
MRRQLIDEHLAKKVWIEPILRLTPVRLVPGTFPLIALIAQHLQVGGGKPQMPMRRERFDVVDDDLYRLATDCDVALPGAAAHTGCAKFLDRLHTKSAPSPMIDKNYRAGATARAIFYCQI